MDTPPPPELKIRAARPQDAETIAALQSLPGFRYGTLRLPYPSPEEVRHWLEAPGDGRELLAFAGDALVGMVGLRHLVGRRAHVGILGMGVHDAWRGQGIGTALMAEIVDFGERWLGLRRLELTVFTDNAPAIALYRKFGFAVEGTHRGFALRDGALVDAYAMARLSG
ncbi:GNAT family N-acetyltransferase [Limobrevibacterium gyesilva]|uniref:GNAT family N-acetyltransferase n=1 Tax=Limobrevibacterium gyesilva TaxID=2991712 RepID=A0AA42CIR6_9PROT|nr:GNAT family N-acetyltransferase [Limobrevibacterium gyesilva]MCW3476165.1 GNAT family N-acetyltransferase [Limobrevibacterium gyesilva]